ncbi:class A beta-lactamase-related serine hydrolase [Wenzhouxiangella sp. 15181]|nr:class A beta-lactamase-related serine hydrolase [Wenzhouxiangella sp. 15181]RFP70390.1 class A beta-lactamase-related serine hydrolase [Wenzhouxiangella sp. 15190]
MPFPGQDIITRRLLAFCMIASACLCVPHTGHTGELADDTVARLDSVLEDLRAAHDVPGLAVGILENSEPVYAKGFGVRSLETDAPVDADTLFPVASISKTFTATAIMQLAERQAVDLNARLSTYLPQFRHSGISILNLLTHTAGLPDDYAPTGRSGEEAVPAYVAQVAYDGTDFTPGTDWAYADTHFNILGAVVQSLTETPFPDYAKDKLLEPLGMTRSSFRPVADMENVALPHTGWLTLSPGGGRPWDVAFAPSEGLHSSARDMLIWAKANLDNDPRLLLPGNYATVHKLRTDTAWDGVRMALGWQVEGPPGSPVLRHAGGMDGVAALLTLYPDTERAIVILSNSEKTPRFEIRRAINAILDGETYTPQSGSGMGLWGVLLGILLGAGALYLGFMVCRHRKS